MKYWTTMQVMPFIGEIPPPNALHDWRLKEVKIVETYRTESVTDPAYAGGQKITNSAITRSLICIWFAEEDAPKGEKVEIW